MFFSQFDGRRWFVSEVKAMLMILLLPVLRSCSLLCDMRWAPGACLPFLRDTCGLGAQRGPCVKREARASTELQPSDTRGRARCSKVELVSRGEASGGVDGWRTLNGDAEAGWGPSSAMPPFLEGATAWHSCWTPRGWSARGNGDLQGRQYDSYSTDITGSVHWKVFVGWSVGRMGRMGKGKAQGHGKCR